MDSVVLKTSAGWLPRLADGAVDVPVIVAGAGPVGLSLACELARQGVRHRLVDAAPARGTVSRATDLHARSLELWDHTGVASTILDAALPITGVPLFSGGREVARLDFGGVDSPFPAAVSLRQREQRVPDAGPLVRADGGTTSLLDLLRDPGLQLWLCAGARDPGPLLALAERFAPALRVLVLVISDRPPVRPNGVDIVADPALRAHGRLGAVSDAAYVVRPDGYLGFRCEPPDAGALASASFAVPGHASPPVGGGHYYGFEGSETRTDDLAYVSAETWVSRSRRRFTRGRGGSYVTLSFDCRADRRGFGIYVRVGSCAACSQPLDRLTVRTQYTILSRGLHHHVGERSDGAVGDDRLISRSFSPCGPPAQRPNLGSLCSCGRSCQTGLSRAERSGWTWMPRESRRTRSMST
jgi:hypothetical protein